MSGARLYGATTENPCASFDGQVPYDRNSPKHVNSRQNWSHLLQPLTHQPAAPSTICMGAQPAGMAQQVGTTEVVIDDAPASSTDDKSTDKKKDEKEPAAPMAKASKASASLSRTENKE